MKNNQLTLFRRLVTLALSLALCLALVPALSAAMAVDEGLEAAKAAALAHAELTAEQVVFTKARQTTEDRVAVYDIEFYHGQVEYDYEIAVKDLAILEVDMDIEDFAAPAALADGGQAVTLEVAKVIALNDAGFQEKDVTFRKAKLDRDDGMEVFDIEFVVGGVEYEYEIATRNGQILEKSVDKD